MSKEPVEVVLQGVDAFNRRDVDGLVGVMHPEVVWEEGGVVFPDLPAAYHGRDGVRRWYQEAIADAWETFTVEPVDLRDEGDGRVVQIYRIRGRGRGSGVDVDMKIVQTMTVVDGHIVHRTIALAED